ncbi:hypothetical protein GQ600_20637 [Phytophthora cactorum]|nr:hypothetical protein GQ600_20637 [Phytophthora cactorum]
MSSVSYSVTSPSTSERFTTNPHFHFQFQVLKSQQTPPKTTCHHEVLPGLVIAAMAIAAVNGQSGANTTPVATSAAAPTAGSTATATTAPATGATTAASGAVDPTVGAGSAAVDTTVGSSTSATTSSSSGSSTEASASASGSSGASQITMGAACVTVMAVGAYFL